MKSSDAKAPIILSTPILNSKCFKYAEDVATSQIVAYKKNILGCKRFLSDLDKMGQKNFRWHFDIEKTYRPIDFKERFMVPTKGDIDRMELFRQVYKDTGGNIPFLESGVTANALHLSPVDGHAFDVERVTRSRVAMVYNIPPHLLGDYDLTVRLMNGLDPA